MTLGNYCNDFMQMCNGIKFSSNYTVFGTQTITSCVSVVMRIAYLASVYASGRSPPSVGECLTILTTWQKNPKVQALMLLLALIIYLIFIQL